MIGVGSAIDTCATFEFQVRGQRHASSLSGYSRRDTATGDWKAGTGTSGSMNRGSGSVVEGVIEGGEGAGWGSGYGFAGRRDSYASTGAGVGRGHGKALSGILISGPGDTIRESGEEAATPMSSRLLLAAVNDEIKRDSASTDRIPETEMDGVSSSEGVMEVEVEFEARRANVYRDSHATFGSSGTLPLPDLLSPPNSP